MDGNEQLQSVIVYLTRLTGEAIAPGSPVRLRSIHRAAFTSWARAHGISLRADLLSGSDPFLLSALLGIDHPVTSVASNSPSSACVEAASMAAPVAIGVDIEAVANLPETDDFREHAFFQNHFTAAETAYCIRQRDARASFCGLWAAKEAILKTGLVSASETLRDIEITRDPKGRPGFPGASLSISHTPDTAVAVCVVLPAAPRPMPQASSRTQNALNSLAASTSSRRGLRFWQRA